MIVSKDMLKFLFFVLSVHGAYGVCSKGWESYNGNCYLISTAKETFGAAQAVCQALGAHLVAVDDDLEDKFLLQKVGEKHDTKSAYWSGGNDLEIEGDYKWLHSGTPFSYTKWAPGQPDNDENEDCITFWMPSNGLWHDADCQWNEHFICEKIDENAENIIG